MSASASPTQVGDLEVVRLSGSLGAEIRGISLAQTDPDEAETIRSLLIEHLVLFFPDQHLSVEEHVAFGRHFGELEGHPNLKNPFSDQPDERLRGMCLYRVGSIERARELAGADPAVKAGRLEVQVLTWWVKSGRMVFPKAVPIAE